MRLYHLKNSLSVLFNAASASSVLRKLLCQSLYIAANELSFRHLAQPSVLRLCKYLCMVVVFTSLLIMPNSFSAHATFTISQYFGAVCLSVIKTDARAQFSQYLPDNTVLVSTVCRLRPGRPILARAWSLIWAANIVHSSSSGP